MAALALQCRHGLGEPVARLALRVGVEDRADQRGQQPVLIARAWP
jgi:hypothetical protein